MRIRVTPMRETNSFDWIHSVIRKIVAGGQEGETFDRPFLHAYRCNSVQFEGMKVSKC